MAAVSRSVAEVLTGPERGFRVLTAWPAVLHLLLDPPQEYARPEVLALLGEGAVRLPLGVLLAPDERRLLGAARVGDRGVVGKDRIELGGTPVRATRWWDPSLPAPRRQVAPDLEPVEALATVLPALPDEVVAPAARLGDALTAADPDAVRQAVERLVGLGPGLTPAGDDVLVGALAARPGGGLAEGVDAVLAAGPDRTAALSAALLDQALRGYGLPQLAALLRALDGPPGAAVARAAEDLVGVGGTSGAAIGHGLLLGLRAAAHAAGRAA